MYPAPSYFQDRRPKRKGWRGRRIDRQQQTSAFSRARLLAIPAGAPELAAAACPSWWADDCYGWGPDKPRFPVVHEQARKLMD